MSVQREKGVLEHSVKHFMTPSPLARKVLFYVTRCGHYFCSEKYLFISDIGAGQPSGRHTFVLLCVRAGSLSLLIDGQQYKAGADAAVLIDCRLPYSYQTLESSEFIWLQFGGANSAAFYDHITQLRGKVFPVHDGGNTFKLAEAFVCGCGYASSGVETTCSQELHGLLCQLLLPQSEKTKEAEASPVELAVRHMQAHLSEHLSMGEVAAYVGISVPQLNRLFRSKIGMSPYQFLLLKRMDKAKNLLLTTDLSIRSIAGKVGYGEETTFSSAFAERVGTPPLSYRKNAHWMDY